MGHAMRIYHALRVVIIMQHETEKTLDEFLRNHPALQMFQVKDYNGCGWYWNY